MKFQYRIGTAVASTALMMNLLAPAAFADTNLEIWGNGAHSDNSINITNTDNTTVNQSNNSSVSLNISAKSSTGGNKANKNTGGNTTIDTGNANTTVNVTVAGGVNSANITACGCEQDDNLTLKVTNNGANTTNNATVNNTKKKAANQTSNSSVSGSIKVKAKTGKNKAKKNTGGDVEVTTGNATSNTTVDVVNPVNVLEL